MAVHLKHRTAFQDQSNGLTTCPLKINSTFESYYSKFYTTESPPTESNMDIFLNSMDILTIDMLAPNSLEQPIFLADSIRQITLLLAGYG